MLMWVAKCQKYRVCPVQKAGSSSPAICLLLYRMFISKAAWGVRAGCWDYCSRVATSRWWRGTSRRTPGPRNSGHTSACTGHSSCTSHQYRKTLDRKRKSVVVSTFWPNYPTLRSRGEEMTSTLRLAVHSFSWCFYEYGCKVTDSMSCPL